MSEPQKGLLSPIGDPLGNVAEKTLSPVGDVVTGVTKPLVSTVGGVTKPIMDATKLDEINNLGPDGPSSRNDPKSSIGGKPQTAANPLGL